MRDGGGRFGQPIFPRSRSGSESESELSQSLARTKIRSYGSTASVTASLGEKYIEHRVTDSDTLQGIALKYGVTVRFPHSRCSVTVSSDLTGREAGFNSFHQSSVRDERSQHHACVTPCLTPCLLCAHPCQNQCLQSVRGAGVQKYSMKASEHAV